MLNRIILTTISLVTVSIISHATGSQGLEIYSDAGGFDGQKHGTKNDHSHEFDPAKETSSQTSKNQRQKFQKTNSADINQAKSRKIATNGAPELSFSGPREIKSGIILPTDTHQEKLLQIRSGDILEIEILSSIIAFPEEKTPVVAEIKSRTLQNAKLFGQARLEKNSHRIFIEFERISFNQSTYELKASGVTKEGQPGFEGEYHSREGAYFAGDFISSFVAGYFDSQVPRSTNAFGQIQEDKTVDAAFKKGVASGAMSSAERFKEALKKAPEFSELQGPFKARLLVFEGGQRL